MAGELGGALGYAMFKSECERRSTKKQCQIDYVIQSHMQSGAALSRPIRKTSNNISEEILKIMKLFVDIDLTKCRGVI